MSEHKKKIKQKHLQIVKRLHENWEPHEGQLEVGRAMIKDRVKKVFVQCGRKWGKTEYVIYMLWRTAVSTPNAKVYYFSPTQRQSKEIIWAPRRLQNFGPRDWLLPGSLGINNTEMRMNFINGSFIKVDGSDSESNYRGIDGHLVVFDEFKDFKPGFYISMSPNLAVRDTPLLIVGTPPERDCQYTELADEYQREDDCLHIMQPTWKNPHISREWLENEKRTLIARGEEDVWLREYEGKFVKGGKRSIFPMWSNVIKRPRADILQELARDKRKLQWYCLADPGTVTCFAVLLIALNPYTKKVYTVYEIYEQDQRETSSKKMWQKIQMMLLNVELEIDDIDFCRDEAASWFENEILDLTSEKDYGPIYFRPVSKAMRKKEIGLSNIKDMILEGRYEVAEECEKHDWEMGNYVRDDKDNIPKKDDHTIDLLRYFLDAAQYYVRQEDEPLTEVEKGVRGRTIEQDLEEDGFDDTMFLGMDWNDY